MHPGERELAVRRLLEQTPVWHLHLDDVSEHGDAVLVLGRLRQTHPTIDTYREGPFAMIWRWEGDRLGGCELFHAHEPALRVLGLPVPWPPP
jgi:hypothetical protein